MYILWKSTIACSFKNFIPIQQVLSVEKIIDSSKHILRQTMSGKDRNTSGNQTLEVNLLQFIHAYLQRSPKDQLFSIKSILMSFLRDGMNFNASPQTLFVLINMYYLFVSHIQCPDDKRSRKELQVCFNYFGIKIPAY